jgi:hypothetical protein
MTNPNLNEDKSDLKKSPSIEIEETSLEDLIVLGDDKLINILIEFPTDTGEIKTAKAKIKQLTLKELRNVNLERITLDASVQILQKALFTQNEQPFSKELIYALPIGVTKKITQKILELSGVGDEDLKGF